MQLSPQQVLVFFHSLQTKRQRMSLPFHTALNNRYTQKVKSSTGGYYMIKLLSVNSFICFRDEMYFPVNRL